jgi:hypothetical protein
MKKFMSVLRHLIRLLMVILQMLPKDSNPPNPPEGV